MKKYICTILAALMLPVMPLVSGAETAQNTDFSAYTVIEGVRKKPSLILYFACVHKDTVRYVLSYSKPFA